MLSEPSAKNPVAARLVHLISMKDFGASKRDDPRKRAKDVQDIVRMLLAHPGPLSFVGSAVAEANKAFVRGFIPPLAEDSNWSELEWLERLGR